MTVEEVLFKASEKRRLLVQANSVFFNTFDLGEADWWEGAGAQVRHWYTPQEVWYQRKTGRELRQGYEVVVNNACEKLLMRDDDGEPIDITRDVLLQRARAYAA